MAEAAARHAVPFAALRAICDPASRALPHAALAALDQRGRIDLTQVGGIASYENGPWNINATLVRGFGDVHSSRVDVGGASTAAYQAGLWAAMTEFSYYFGLPDNTRLVPKLTFDWMRTRTDAFTEVGGTIPVSGSAVTASRVRMLIGGVIQNAGSLSSPSATTGELRLNAGRSDRYCSSGTSFRLIELMIPFPCTHFRPASMTDHLELSTMIGT